FDAGGLDGHEAFAPLTYRFAVDAGGIAPGQDDEAGVHEGQVDVVDGLLELIMCHEGPLLLYFQMAFFRGLRLCLPPGGRTTRGKEPHSGHRLGDWRTS